MSAKSAVPRHRRNRDGDPVRPVQLTMVETLHQRVAAMASQTKRTVPAMLLVLIEIGLEHTNVGGSGAASQ